MGGRCVGGAEDGEETRAPSPGPRECAMRDACFVRCMEGAKMLQDARKKRDRAEEKKNRKP